MNKLMNGVQTINSREVAEMMEVRHGDLLEKIDKINVDLLNGKIRSVKYWVESIYKDRSGKSNRCFEVTKLGCDFLAHKTTGTKGNLFTARYMDKFEEMKAQLNSPSYMIEDPIARAKAWIKEQEEKMILAQTVEEQQPKVDYYNEVLHPENLRTTTDIAKDLGLRSARELNKLLKDKGVIYKQGGSWKPKADYMFLITDGYADYHINEFGQILKWTEKGRQWIKNLLGM